MIIDIELLGLPLLTGFLFSFSSAPIGCFLAWKRWTFLGDVLGHASLLGIALSLFIGVPWFAGIFAVGVGGGLWVMSKKKSIDLSILSYSSLSLGLLLLSFSPQRFLDPHSLLFGDILTITLQDAFLSFLLGGVTLCFIVFFWKDLLRLVLDDDLAKVEGVRVFRLRFIFLIIMSSTIACGIKISGSLLTPALLTLPPAIARFWSRTPFQMIAVSIFVTWISFVLGVYFSFLFNFPTSSTIVFISFLIFLFSSMRKFC